MGTALPASAEQEDTECCLEKCIPSPTSALTITRVIWVKLNIVVNHAPPHASPRASICNCGSWQTLFGFPFCPSTSVISAASNCFLLECNQKIGHCCIQCHWVHRSIDKINGNVLLMYDISDLKKNYFSLMLRKNQRDVSLQKNQRDVSLVNCPI